MPRPPFAEPGFNAPFDVAHRPKSELRQVTPDTTTIKNPGEAHPKINIPEPLADTIKNTPGLTETFGKDGQMQVLTPHADVLLESFPMIREMPEFKALLRKVLKININQNRTITVEELEWNTINKILKYMGSFEENYKKNGPQDTITTPNNLTEDDAVIFGFSSLINRGMERTWDIRMRYDQDQIVINTLAEKFDRYKPLYGNKKINADTQLVEPPLSTTADVGVFKATIEPTEALAEKALRGDEMLTTTGEAYDNNVIEVREGGESMFAKAKRNQEVNGFSQHAIENNLPDIEPIPIEELPDIVLLHGVGHNEATWKARVDYYKAKGVNNIRYIEWDEFKEGSTFEQQAEEVYQKLKIGWNGKPLAIEGHSWGGLIYWYLAKNHPEMISHAIITSAPTRSRKLETKLQKAKSAILYRGLGWALNHQELSWKLMQKIPALRFFSRLGKDKWPEAFRVYRGHIGDRQWDDVIGNTPNIIPTIRLRGAKDTPVNMAGAGALELGRGGVYMVNPDGDHDVIGDHDLALKIHQKLHAEAMRRRKLILN